MYEELGPARQPHHGTHLVMRGMLRQHRVSIALRLVGLTKQRRRVPCFPCRVAALWGACRVRRLLQDYLHTFQGALPRLLWRRVDLP